MAMNEWLAEMYGTGRQADEAQEKVAELELFAKLAADNGIDLTTLEPQQVSALYAETFGKLAQEEEEEGESAEHEASESKEKEKGEKEEESEEKEKESAAIAEHEAAKEAAAKFAEADIMGRTMAHAFVNELEQIDKEASKVQAAKGFAQTVGEKVIGAGRKLGLSAGKGKQAIGKERAISAGRKAIGIGAGVGAAGAAGGAYALGRKKEASALDRLAAEEALKIAAADGWDTNECIELLNKVLSEGPAESEKIAYVEDTADAITVRGFELLDQCGYNVNWDQVFGTAK